MDDFISFPTVPNMRSITVWMWMDVVQPNTLAFFLDARDGVVDGFFSTLCAPSRYTNPHSQRRPTRGISPSHLTESGRVSAMADAGVRGGAVT